MKIGVIGPHSSCRMIERSLRDIDDSLSVNCYEKEQVNACADVIEVCENECDAILFTFLFHKFLLHNFRLHIL